MHIMMPRPHHRPTWCSKRVFRWTMLDDRILRMIYPFGWRAVNAELEAHGRPRRTWEAQRQRLVVLRRKTPC